MERAFAGDAEVVKSSGKEVSAREESVHHKASVSALDRDKDTVPDPRKMRAHFSALCEVRAFAGNAKASKV